MNLFARIEALIFDLDNTLYDENSYIRAVCEGFCLRHRLDYRLIDSITSDSFRASSRDIFGDWLKGIDYYTPARQEELFFLYENLPPDSIPAHALESIRLYDDALKLLCSLQGSPLKLGILTNGGLKAQARKVELLRLSDFGFHIEYARARGAEYEKPHKDAFDRILARLGVSAQKAVFIGDNPKSDIVGAHNAGLEAIWLKRGYAQALPCTAPHIALHNLNDLRSL